MQHDHNVCDDVCNLVSLCYVRNLKDVQGLF